MGISSTTILINLQDIEPQGKAWFGRSPIVQGTFKVCSTLYCQDDRMLIQLQLKTLILREV